MLVRSLLNFQALHPDRESFERQRRKILSPDNQILHTLDRFPSGTYPFNGVTKPLKGPQKSLHLILFLYRYDNLIGLQGSTDQERLSEEFIDYLTISNADILQEFGKMPRS